MEQNKEKYHAYGLPDESSDSSGEDDPLPTLNIRITGAKVGFNQTKGVLEIPVSSTCSIQWEPPLKKSSDYLIFKLAFKQGEYSTTRIEACPAHRRSEIDIPSPIIISPRRDIRLEYFLLGSDIAVRVRPSLNGRRGVTSVVTGFTCISSEAHNGGGSETVRTSWQLTVSGRIGNTMYAEIIPVQIMRITRIHATRKRKHRDQPRNHRDQPKDDPTASTSRDQPRDDPTDSTSPKAESHQKINSLLDKLNEKQMHKALSILRACFE